VTVQCCHAGDGKWNIEWLSDTGLIKMGRCRDCGVLYKIERTSFGSVHSFSKRGLREMVKDVLEQDHAQSR
jgi:hypothetical protein